MPFKDATGKIITNQTEWLRARNQQRNWETINQIISLRCLPENISPPRKVTEASVTRWSFDFEIEDLSPIGTDHEPMRYLVMDCKDVPMIVGLEEMPDIVPVLDPGPNGNIDFRISSDK